MGSPPRSQLSRLRQVISRSLKKQRALVMDLVRERGPLIRGSFVRQQRSCGRPGCRCARGELHDAAYLSRSIEGRKCNVHVPRQNRPRVEAAAARYRRFRKARAELVVLGRELLRQVDEMEKELTIPYRPPDEQP